MKNTRFTALQVSREALLSYRMTEELT